MSAEAHSVAELELAILQELLQRARDQANSRGLRAELEVLNGPLAQHSWSDHEHRVVYQSLRASLRNAAIPLREQMAAEATRMGHPEIDWSLYWQPAASGRTDLAALLLALRQIDRGSP